MYLPIDGNPVAGEVGFTLAGFLFPRFPCLELAENSGGEAAMATFCRERHTRPDVMMMLDLGRRSAQASLKPFWLSHGRIAP